MSDEEDNEGQTCYSIEVVLGDDTSSNVSVSDSSSEDDDLLYPDDTEDDLDLDYVPPPSASDDSADYEGDDSPVARRSSTQKRKTARRCSALEDLETTQSTQSGPEAPAVASSQQEKALLLAPTSSSQQRNARCSTPGDVQPSQSSQPGSSAPTPSSQQEKARLLAPTSTSDHQKSLCSTLGDGQPSQSPQSDPSPPTCTYGRKRARSPLRSPTRASKRSRKTRLTFAEIGDGDGDKWQDREEEDIKPNPLRFMPARTPGPTFDTTIAWSPLSLFQLFFPESAVKTIIENTNANAARRKKAGLKFKWEVLTVKDFYTFLSIIIYTGLVSVHHRSDYWRQEWPYNFSFPKKKMTRDRFEAILWSLHLSDPSEDAENEKKRNTAKYDRLFKIKPLYDDIVSACKANFQPYQNLAIDERMVATKARAGMKQCFKNKSTKWGYKLFVLADSSIGYTWNFNVYSGKTEANSGKHNLNYWAVTDLMVFPVLGSGYTLYTDNASPALFTALSKKNIGCCGTIKRYYSGFPQSKTNDLSENAERGDIRWMRKDKLLFVKWMDSSEVSMCSTVHRSYSGHTVKRRVKVPGTWKFKSVPVPDCVLDHNKHTSGVDLSDALISFYSFRRKTKWYKSFFFHFVDIAVVNGFLLHTELFKIGKDPKLKRALTQKTFREKLVRSMLEFGERSADPSPPPPPPATCMPMFYDQREGRARKHCRKCLDSGFPRVKTAVYCQKCKVPLCLSSKKNCFKLWHDAL